MRIAVDARALLAGRGVTRYVRRLLTALAEQFPGDDWHAFVPGRAPVEVPEGVTLHRHPLGGRAVFGAASVLGRPPIDMLCGGADVVWLPAPAPVAPGRAPYVLTIHDLSFEDRPGDFTLYERLWHRLARPGLLAGGAARVIAVSEATAAEAARWHVDATVVHSGVDHLAHTGPPHGAPPYFLSVGALEPRKAPDLLSTAHGMARGAGLKAELWFAGEGRMRVKGDGIRALGVPDDDELASLYSGALALVMPSWLEGFGLPPLEAAACLTPSIVSDLAVYAETLGDHAVRVPRGNAVALAGALLRMEREPEARAELARAAHAAVAPFTWARAARETHAVLAEAASA
ncbi:MAG TPA: glycosyltransferase family 1 protein [Solirubrobacteraceae bacterium]|nr:glycosyltransferase family 1 protein [Solirubrobacteraceae bacterium]